mgnify:FL=1
MRSQDISIFRRTFIKEREGGVCMVGFPGIDDVIESVTAPYKKELVLQLPIRYRFNREKMLMSWSTPEAHIIDIDPCYGYDDHFSSNISTPREEIILKDKNSLSCLVAAVCEMAVVEQMHPTLSFPRPEQTSSMLEHFITLYDQTLSIWRDDIMKKHWPDLFSLRCAYRNMYLIQGFNEAFHYGGNANEMHEILYSLAQLKATTERHQDECPAFETIQEQSPQLAINLTMPIQKWKEMPRMTTNPEQNIQQYFQSISQVLEAASFKGTASCERTNGSYHWHLKHKDEEIVM